MKLKTVFKYMGTNFFFFGTCFLNYLLHKNIFLPPYSSHTLNFNSLE